MRRASTKIPFAYFRTATRRRGRPIHRIYSATPRGEMTGQCLFFNVSPVDPTFTDIVCYSKDGNSWWSAAFIPYADFLTLKGAAEQGQVWNQGFWRRRFGVAPNWSQLMAAGLAGNSLSGPGIGPTPYTPDDSFLF